MLELTSRRRTFALHVGEMMLVMLAGMVVLGGAIAGLAALAGVSASDTPIALDAGVMAFSMTAPMVWWMRRRGHGARDNAEMAGSMIVPTVLAVALHAAGAIGAGDVLLLQHAVMIPAMVGVMLWRYDHYAH